MLPFKASTWCFHWLKGFQQRVQETGRLPADFEKTDDSAFQKSGWKSQWECYFSMFAFFFFPTLLPCTITDCCYLPLRPGTYTQNLKNILYFKQHNLTGMREMPPG